MILLSFLACLAPGLGGDETDGVTASDDLSIDAFASAATSDLSELAQGAAGVASLAGASRLDPATADVCEPTRGDCVACLTLTPEGNGAGTFLIEPEATPCSASWTSARGVTYSWSLDASTFEGTYAPYEQGRQVVMGGARTATIARSGGDAEDASWSATLVLSELVAQTDGTGGVVSYVLALSYEGFGDALWTLTAEGGGGALTGTATNGERSCTVSGTAVEPVIACD